MATININTVVNVSVSAPPAGLAPYSVNNVAVFTKDTPVVSLGTDTYRVYSNATDVGTDWGTTSNTYKAAVAIFSQSPNILSGGGLLIVCPMLALETLDAAIPRLTALAYFGGCSYTYSATADEVQDAAAVVQASRQLLFVASSTSSDLDDNGLLYEIQAAGLSQTRTLFYSVAGSLAAFKWGYIGRAMSTNFSAPNSTSTMHLKQIAGVSADSGITETLRAKCETIGADCYPAIAGRASVLCYGANGFFDDVYNLQWLVGAIQVAGFNALAQTSTKLPQTETGMNFLKGAYRVVMEQAASNRFIGGGSWTSPDTFGDVEDFHRNIVERGFYIYSIPVSQQTSVDRAARKAPVVLLAAKFQGAIHKSDVTIYVNQ